MFDPALETHKRESLVRPHRMVRNLGDEGHVFVGRQAWDQVVELKYEPYGLATICGEVALIEARKLETLEKQMAAARTIEAPHNVEEGRFPAAGRSEQDDHFGGPDFKVDTAQCAHFNLAGRINLSQ